MDAPGNAADSMRALAVVRQAVARVLEVDPAIVRVDTPLADIGGDEVAMIAIVDLIVGEGPPVRSLTPDVWARVGEQVRAAITVGDLLPLVDPGGVR